MKKNLVTMLVITMLFYINETKAQDIVKGNLGMYPQFIDFKNASAVFKRGSVILADDKGGMSVSSNALLDHSEKDNIGMEHFRYQQVYAGIPVEHAVYIIHVKGNAVLSQNGKWIKDFPVGLKNTASLSFTAALQKAMDAVGAQSYKWQIPAEEAFIKREQNDMWATFYPKSQLVWYSGENEVVPSALKLAYKIDIYSQSPLSRQIVFVDAVNGSILGKRELIHSTNATGTAVTAYSGTQTITTDFTGSAYRLRETGRGNGINTFDMRQSSTSYGLAVDFTDADNNWNNINPNKDQYATDAHWATEKTYDYFLSKFNRNSIDNAGFALNSYVHTNLMAFGFPNNVNAFWDGSRMTYGDGSANYTPLTTVDICGHEITHGITGLTSGLVYSYESGAMNEGFSDIFGTAIEFYAKGNSANWLIGENIGASFRNMSNPNQFNHPDTYLGNFWYTGSGDNGGVHTNSGVLNFWFYLLSQGGSGVNDIGNLYSVGGIGINKAAAIAYRTNTTYLISTSKYADARTCAIRSAIDLYGAGSAEEIATTNAWYAVGIGAPYSSITNVSAAINPLPANSATDIATNATLSWTSGANAQLHKIYFGTTNPPVFKGNQTANTYNPGSLAYNTVYYWRVDEKNNTDSVTGNIWSFTTTTELVNLALNKPATASSVENNSLGANLAVDGNTLTRWSSNFSDTQWIAVDLQNVYNINRVKLKWDPAYAKNFSIDVSTDGISWKTIKMVYGNMNLNGDYANLSDLARYIRIYCTVKGTSWGYSLYEFEVYGMLGTPATNPVPANLASSIATNTTLSWTAGTNAVSYDVYLGSTTPLAFKGNQTATNFNPGALINNITYYWRVDERTTNGTITGNSWRFSTTSLSTNVALNKPVSASSVENNSFTANLAVDGNYATRWSSNSSDTQWIAVDLQKTYLIDRVLLKWDSAYGKNFSIDASADGINWTTIRTVTGNTSLLINHLNGLNFSARYIRMYGTARGTTKGYSLDEFLVYGILSGTAATNPFPAVATTGVATNTMLGWNAGENAISHDVYFGTSNPPVFKRNQTATVFDPGPLTNATTYYWRVDEKNTAGTIAGKIWSYTTTAEISNIALNKPATASSVENYNNLSPILAVDGKTTTRWSSNFSDTQWVAIDLQKIYLIKRVLLKWEAAYGKNFSIDVSTDGINWTTIKAVTGNKSLTNDYTNLNSLARYIRMYGTARGTAWGYSLYEFEVYGTLGSPASIPVPTALATNITTNPVLSWTAGENAISHNVYFGTTNPPEFKGNQTTNTFSPGTLANNTTYYWRVDENSNSGLIPGNIWSFTTSALMNNLALNKPTTASSVEGNSNNYVPNYAVDGNNGTRWSSNWSDPQWITVDLQNTYNVKKVVLNWEAAYGKNFSIDVSKDGINWTTIKAVTGNGFLTNVYDSLNTTGRYIRIYGTARGTGWGYSLYEFEVYGMLQATGLTTPNNAMVTGGAESEQKIAASAIYPNPSNGIVNIRVQLSNPGKVNISILNSNGQKVGEINKSNLPAGQNLIQWNGKMLPDGIYLMNIKTPQAIIQQKLIIIK